MTANREMSCTSINDFATMPRDESGDFLSQEFDNPVVEATQFYDDETTHARIFKERIVMENDTYYEVTSTRAKQRTIDVGIVATAAWLTHDKGLNQDRALRAAKRGIDTVFISPQQNLDRRGHFGKSVCNIISIAEYLHDRDLRDPDHLWIDGISRGGMHGIGVTAKAPHIPALDQSLAHKEVIYGDYTVPCFPEGLSPMRDLPQLPSMIANEFGAATAFVQLPLAAMRHYPRTVAFHPKMLFQHLKEVPTLLSGAAGDAARNMPENTFGHVTNYLGDIMGQGRRWEPIFAEYPNLTVENFEGGGHLSLVDMRCQDAWQQRMEAVHEVIEAQPSIVSLGSTAVAGAVHAISPAHRHRPIAA